MSDAQAPTELTEEQKAQVAALQEKWKSFPSESAMMIAYERQLESARPDALFHDPMAAALAGDRGAYWSEQLSEHTHTFGLGGWRDAHRAWTAVRTRFIDDQCTGEAARQCTQMVNLGAGLDTRAFRLQPYPRAVFDVDVADINDAKRKVLVQELEQLPSDYNMVSADLSAAGALERELGKAGFDADSPSVFLAEGIIMYLGDKQEQLLEEITAIAAPQSLLVLNFVARLLSRDKLTEVLQGGWRELRFYRFGEEPLDMGRFNHDQCQPTDHLSFLVAERV